MTLEHVALYVRDPEAARDFFVKYGNGVASSGYHNPKTGLRTYFVSFGEGARVEVMARPDLDRGEVTRLRAGYDHLAFRLESRDAVDSLTNRLRGDGYAVLSGPRVTGDGYYESCVSGPEECLLELTV